MEKFDISLFEQEDNDQWPSLRIWYVLFIVRLPIYYTYMYIRVIQHIFKQSQTEPVVLNVIQDLKTKISEKSDQNWGCNSSALLGWGAAKIGRSAVFGCFNLFLACCNFSFDPNFLKFWIWGTELAMKL